MRGYFGRAVVNRRTFWLKVPRFAPVLLRRSPSASAGVLITDNHQLILGESSLEEQLLDPWVRIPLPPPYSHIMFI